MTPEELNKQKNKYESVRDHYVKALNDSETEAVRQLILVATVFLTASLFVLQKDNLEVDLSQIFKIILVLSWSSFIISMGLGVSIFIKDRRFFGDWATAAESIAEAISKRVVDSQEKINSLVNITFNKLPQNTSDSILKLQIASLGLGIIGLLIVSSVFIF